MNPERWRELKDVFDRTLEQDPEHRSGFLREACHGDAELLQEVESLLASHKSADGFLEKPAIEGAQGLLEHDSGAGLVGLKIGPYELRKKLGHGGMGVVYLADDTRLGRQVAIKALAPQHTSDDEHRERLKREARVAATISHPAIATVYALEEHGGNFYIVSEYVRGRTLFEEMARGPLSPALLIETGLEVARAMAVAHAHGIIHRDLKPENVIRTPEGAIKILDFGLARFQSAQARDSLLPTRLTKSGIFLGTPAYASPEQLLGGEVDFHTDIFSFGVMLYELASGKHPFAASDSVTTIARILEAEPLHLSYIRPMLPVGLDRVVRRCLQKNPTQRYGSAGELVSDLELVKNESTPGPISRHQEPAPDAPATRRPLWWWQFHQAVVGLMYYAMLLPMWKVKTWSAPGWGQLIFFSTVVAVGLAANLRFHLWFTSVSYPAELAEQRRSVMRWIRYADVLFVLLLIAGSIAIHGEHEVYTTLLVGVAIGVLGAFLLIEPTTTRAAFGSVSKPASEVMQKSQH